MPGTDNKGAPVRPFGILSWEGNGREKKKRKRERKVLRGTERRERERERKAGDGARQGESTRKRKGKKAGELALLSPRFFPSPR